MKTKKDEVRSRGGPYQLGCPPVITRVFRPPFIFSRKLALWKEPTCSVFLSFLANFGHLELNSSENMWNFWLKMTQRGAVLYHV